MHEKDCSKVEDNKYLLDNCQYKNFRKSSNRSVILYSIDKLDDDYICKFYGKFWSNCNIMRTMIGIFNISFWYILKWIGNKKMVWSFSLFDDAFLKKHNILWNERWVIKVRVLELLAIKIALRMMTLDDELNWNKDYEWFSTIWNDVYKLLNGFYLFTE